MESGRNLNVKLRNAITKDVKISLFFRELAKDLNENFLEDNDAIKEIIEHYTGMTSSEFDKLITKNKRKNKKVEEKFQPKGLKKPNILSIYCAKYKAECEKKGKKFDMKEKNEAYNALSTKEKEKLRKEYDGLMEEYVKNTEEQRQKAISDGKIPADKPKRPINGYMRFANTVREEITAEFADEEPKNRLNKITTAIGARWNALSDKEKDKYNAPYKKEMEKFNGLMKEWKVKEAQRKKNHGDEAGEESEAEVETTGKAKKAEPKKSKKAESEKEESENEESEKEEEKPKKKTDAKKAESKESDKEESEKDEDKPKKKAESKKTESKKSKKAESEKEESEKEDAEEVEEEEEKPKKKGKASKA